MVVKTAAVPANNADAAKPEIQLFAVTATVTSGGVLLRWRTSADPDNIGFNVYRIRNGERSRANGELIPGAMFAPHLPASTSTSISPQTGHSYSWLDRNGAVDATYFIETVSVDGATSMHEPVTPSASKTNSEFQQTAATSDATISAADLFNKSYPAAEAQQPNTPSGTIQEQWAIAAQPALKIAIKKDGWYRVTQPQMAAVGFNTAGDIRNLRLFVDANEVAISTSQSSGAYGSSDYLEFYGRGIDTTTTDTRIYYLTSGNTPGKRVLGEIKVDADPDLPPPPPAPTATPLPPVGAESHPLVLRNPIFFSWVLRDSFEWTQLELVNKLSAPPQLDQARVVLRDPGGAEPRVQPSENSLSTPNASSAPLVTSDSRNAPVTNAANPRTTKTSAPAPLSSAASPALLAPNRATIASDTKRSRTGSGSRKRRKAKQRKPAMIQRHHAALADNFAPANFDYTFQLKERLVYFSNLLNGDQENFFGRVVSSNPVNQTVVVANPDPNTPATLEFALQGVANQFASNHQVNVSFNGVQVGSITFDAIGHPERSIAIPQVLNGNNTVTFTKVSTGEVCLVDYVRLTYRHRYTADSGSLKFNLRGSQTLAVDGFSTPAVQLVDYTDPLNVQVFKPAAESSGSGYAITVPTTASRSKDQRLLFALPSGQFDAPASLSLNQPSTLNLNANAADFLIVSHKTLISSMAPLLALRQTQGMATAIVDVEDVYDEFGYGLHGPQAIKDFLQRAATQWATPPRYLIFAGDGSYDPRSYEGVGDFDLVPTKLIDATYSETASDDWLADFDHDGTADIPVGRLPFKSPADADKIIDKIVHFTPANVPQAALLIADDPGTPPLWDFESSSDAVEQLLPPSITVQRVNVRVDGAAQAKVNVINGFNSGRSVVNYSGHGSVDVWSGASIFNSSDATALTNGNKLSFVIVMDCLNGYYLAPTVVSLAEAFLKAPNGGAVAAFASSGLTITYGQRQMELELYRQLYGATPIALGDAIKLAKNASSDPDVRSTWIYFGDPSIKIR